MRQSQLVECRAATAKGTNLNDSPDGRSETRVSGLRQFYCLNRGGDPERFRDEARGLGRVDLLVHACGH